MWNLRAAILFSMGWLARKLIVVSLLVGDWFSVYINFEICLFACYSQVKNVYGALVFVGGVEHYVFMYLIYVCVDGLRVDFRCVVYEQNVIYVSCV